MEPLTWAAIIAAAGSVTAVVKFWLDMGRLAEKAERAADTATLLAAKVEHGTYQLSDFKVAVAQTYATHKSLAETEAALERGIEGIHNRLDKVTDRLDSLITIAKKNGT
jgi:hypothetical protein